MIDRDQFNEQFERFKSLIPAHDKESQAFTDFNKGGAHRLEGYKPVLRDRALGILALETWAEAEIGSGAILERMIKAVEIKGNNLVTKQPRWGPGTAGHQVLLVGRQDADLRHKLERYLFDLFVDTEDEGTTFDRLKSLPRVQYPLLGYLFFLRDMDRFMPIRPTIFDRAFRKLGIDLVTTHKASWENYQQFNTALGDVRSALAELDGLANVRLIDAHSFCWIIEYILKFDSKKAVSRMLRSISQATGPARVQIVKRTTKNKYVLMSQEEQKELIEFLLEQQRNRCALTGIPFDDKIDDLRPSADRIDSDKHYEKGNLQIVCQFVNFWKSDRDNEEFKGLLRLVRHESSFHV